MRIVLVVINYILGVLRYVAVVKTAIKKKWGPSFKMSRSFLSAYDVGYIHWLMQANRDPLSANHRADSGERGGA